MKQLSSHVLDNHASPTGRTATKEEDVNNEKDNLLTIATGVFCCKNETPSGLHSNQFEDQTQREEGCVCVHMCVCVCVRACVCGCGCVHFHSSLQLTLLCYIGMPLWAITILSVSVVLGVVGVAILVVFIFSTFNQKGTPVQTN